MDLQGVTSATKQKGCERRGKDEPLRRICPPVGPAADSGFLNERGSKSQFTVGVSAAFRSTAHFSLWRNNTTDARR